MAKSSSTSEVTKPEKTKVGAMETTELKNYTFPTIGDGVVIQASSQEEAEKAAAKLRADMEKQKKTEEKKDETKDEEA